MRKDGTLPWLRPDGKTQVTVEYAYGRPKRVDTVLVSTQHAPDISQEEIRRGGDRTRDQAGAAGRDGGCEDEDLRQPDRALRDRRTAGRRRRDRAQDHRRHLRRDGPARRRRFQRQGSHQGGPLGGVRRALGGEERGGSRAGAALRDPGGLCHRRGAPAERQRGDLRHRAHPGRGAIARLIGEHFDLRPGAIIRDLDLRRPIYRQVAAYGHFGRDDLDLPWEDTDKAEVLRQAAGLQIGEAVPAD